MINGNAREMSKKKKELQHVLVHAAAVVAEVVAKDVEVTRLDAVVAVAKDVEVTRLDAAVVVVLRKSSVNAKIFLIRHRLRERDR
jgi:hypothetical protein